MCDCVRQPERPAAGFPVIQTAEPGCRELCGLWSEYTRMLQTECRPHHLFSCLPAPCTECPKTGQSLCYLGMIDGQVAGGICLKKLDNTRCEICRLYVRPHFRGHTVAGSLLDRCIETAHQLGFHQLFLGAFPFLLGAIHLYERRGFYRVCALHNQPENGMVWFGLDL